MANFDDVKKAIDFHSRIPAWTLHDARRTFCTRLSLLQVDSEIAERLIGHVPAGIRAVYDVHEYRAEKATAMRRWSQHLQQILNPPKDKIVKLRRR